MLTAMENKTRQDSDLSDQFISTIRGLHFAMKFFGLWPTRASSQHWRNLVWWVQSLCFGFAVFGPIAGTIAHRHEPRKVIDIMGLLFALTCAFLKWFTLATCRNTVDKLLHSMAEDWSELKINTLINESVPDSKLIMLKYASLAKAYFFTYIAMMSIGSVNYVRDSISSMNSFNNNTDPEELLVIPYSWYPLDYHKKSNIQFLVIAHTLTTSDLALVNIAIDSLLVTMSLHLCGQLKILGCFVEGIRFDSSNPQFCEMKIRLMVKRHQELLGFGKRIQASFSYIILEQSVACTLTICFLEFAFLAEMDRVDVRAIVLVKVGFICGATLQTMFSYCHVGDLLVNQSTILATAIYNAEWYNFTGPMTSTCLIVMTRTKRPIALTGAKFVQMSLETFTSLLKASASYVTVLRSTDMGQGDIPECSIGVRITVLESKLEASPELRAYSEPPSLLTT